MRLTRHTDYALRVLMYLALEPDRLCSIGEIARDNRVSENHLMKVVQALGQLGFVTTLRGRGGGLKLARPPRDITVGEVVRALENGAVLLDCASCRLVSACVLTSVLSQALSAFLAVLDRYTIADLSQPGESLKALLTAECPEDGMAAVP